MYGDVWIDKTDELLGMIVTFVAGEDDRTARREGDQAAESSQRADGEEDGCICC